MFEWHWRFTGQCGIEWDHTFSPLLFLSFHDIRTFICSVLAGIISLEITICLNVNYILTVDFMLHLKIEESSDYWLLTIERRTWSCIGYHNNLQTRPTIKWISHLIWSYDSKNDCLNTDLTDETLTGNWGQINKLRLKWSLFYHKTNYPANKLCNNYVFFRHFLVTNKRKLKRTIL